MINISFLNQSINCKLSNKIFQKDTLYRKKSLDVHNNLIIHYSCNNNPQNLYEIIRQKLPKSHFQMHLIDGQVIIYQYFC